MECTVLPPIITCMFLAMLKSQLSGWNCRCMYVARLLWAFDAEISPFLEHDDFFLKYSVLLRPQTLPHNLQQWIRLMNSRIHISRQLALPKPNRALENRTKGK